MSHFAVVVVVPAKEATTQKKAEAIVAKLLKPYDENTQVPEYEQTCYCVGRKARKEAREHADKTVGTIDELRASFNKANPMPPGDNWGDTLTDKQHEARNKAWDAHIKPYNVAEKTFFMKHKLRKASNPECEECHGSGKSKTTYNPKSQWDWYRIGGRWDGSIQAKPRESQNGFNFGEEHTYLENNSVPVLDYVANLKTFTGYALVTPDGVWHQKGSMGWWGMSSGDVSKKTWHAKVRKALKPYADAQHVAILIDCHI